MTNTASIEIRTSQVAFGQRHSYLLFRKENGADTFVAMAKFQNHDVVNNRWGRPVNGQQHQKITIKRGTARARIFGATGLRNRLYEPKKCQKKLLASSYEMNRLPGKARSINL